MEGSLANPLQQTNYSTQTQKPLTLSNEITYEDSPRANNMTKKEKSNSHLDQDSKIVKKS
jgi:hypothetical protein